MTRSHPSNNTSLSQFMPCNQIEADSRMFYTLLSTWHNNIYIRTVNSNIVVIADSPFTSPRFTKLWVGFGSGKRFQTIITHAIVKTTSSSFLTQK